MLEPFRLLIFDWDGTLLDSIGAIVGCTQETLRELGQPAMDERRIRDLIGLGLRETVEALCPGCDDELYQAVLETYRRLWIDRFRFYPEPFVGVRDALAELGGMGYLMAVATAKGRRGLDRDLERAALGGHFHSTRTVDEAQSKPHPQMLLDILDELGVTPRHALMIGDTVHDLQMAANAGVAAVAVASGAQRREVLEAQEPLACFATVAELPRWLAGRGGRAALA